MIEDKFLSSFGLAGQGKVGQARSGLASSISAKERQLALGIATGRQLNADRLAQQKADARARGAGGRGRGRGRGRGGGDGYDMDFVADAEAEESLVDDLLSRAGGDRLEESGIGGQAGIYSVKDPFAKTPDEIQEEINKRRELAELRTAELEAERAYWNQSIDHSRTWSESWIQSIDEVDARMSVITTTMRGFEDVTRAVVRTIAMGGKMTVKAVAEITKGVALQIGIEATIQALMNTAKAIAEGVSSWGASPRVAGFASAAATYTATAAMAFGVAGGAGMLARKGGSSGARESSSVPARDYSDSMAGRRESGNTEVTVILQGDAEGLFRAVVQQNERSMMAGNQSMSW